MGSSQTVGRRHGLTLVQWGLLFVAFTVGLGSSFIMREAFPHAHAGVVQTAPTAPDAAK